MTDVRMLAFRLLEGWERDDTYLNLSMNSPMTVSLTREEKGFLTALLYGTAERKLTLDYLIGVAAARSDIDPTVRNILRLGFFQLFFMEKIPSHAAVTLTVSLAKGKVERGFVNGVMRGALRKFTKPDGTVELPFPPRERSVPRYLSIVYSFPLPLVKFFISQLGENETEQLLSHFNREAPLTLAVNLLKCSREELKTKFTEAGIPCEETAYSPLGLRVLSSIPVTALPGFSDGLFYVQDEASQLTSSVLKPLSGMTLVDTCSCPGGKSFAAAIAMGDKGKIYSFDLHESKLPLISEGAARLGIGSISVGERDALNPDPALLGTCDRVLCDVPCSGLGVLGKKPDLRYHAIDRIDELPALQKQILEASSAYLKEDGRMLYSTCTLNPGENIDVVNAFLAFHPDFETVPFSINGMESDDGFLTLYPHRNGTDGFFFALLSKRKKNP